MRIAIIGAGAIGQTVGRLLAAAGHDVVVSWSSSQARLQLAAERIGHGAGSATPVEAVRHAEAVLFAHRDSNTSTPLPGPADPSRGKS